MMKTWGGLKTLPLFDIGLYVFVTLCPIFYWSGISLNQIQGVFFVFGIFALLALSLTQEKIRDFKSNYLAFFVLWSLVGIFIHSAEVSLFGSSVGKYINFCLLAEGFVFVLCGSILYYLIISYSSNFKIIYPILIINILNFTFAIMQAVGLKLIWSTNDSVISGFMGHAPHLGIFSAISIPILWNYKKPLVIMPIVCIVLAHIFWAKSFTGLFALIIAVGIYLLIHKRKWGVLWLLAWGVYIFFRKEIFLYKAGLRLDIYIATLKEIMKHPYLGWGFDNTMGNNMIVVRDQFIYRHNDYLNIIKDLGIPFGIVGIAFLYNALKNVKKDYLWVSVLVVLISCMTWTSMYFVRIACVGIVLLALKEREKWKKKSQ